MTGREPAYHRLALALAMIPFALHLAALTRVDFSGDELYSIVCGRHTALDYVDVPPLIAWAAAASQAAGESLWLLRIIPAVFHVGAVLAACAVVRVLGGGRYAQVSAGLATGLAPLLLGATATMNSLSLEPLSWTIVAYAALRARLNDARRWWIVAGFGASLAVEGSAMSALFLGSLAIGLGLSAPATLKQREFWLGGLLTGVVAAPTLVWQAAHGWPVFDVMPLGMRAGLLTCGPVFALLWLLGIIDLTAKSRTRFLGAAALVLAAAIIVLPARDAALAGLSPLMFAAGSIRLESLLRAPALRVAYAAIAVVSTLVLEPFAMPLLAEPAFIVYARGMDATLHVGFWAPELRSNEPRRDWRALADRVAVAERSLSPDDRAGAAVFGQTFREAAAVDVFGTGLLPVISAQGSYALWGPRGTHRVLVIVDGRQRAIERAYRDVRATPTNENAVPISIGRDPRRDLIEIWPTLRRDG